MRKGKENMNDNYCIHTQQQWKCGSPRTKVTGRFTYIYTYTHIHELVYTVMCCIMPFQSVTDLHTTVAPAIYNGSERLLSSSEGAAMVTSLQCT